MARIVLNTIGSYGDVLPYLAVAEGLLARGHQVVVAAPGMYRALAERAGAEFAAIRPEIDYDDVEMFRRAMDPKGGAEYCVRELFVPPLRESYADLEAACEGADFLTSHIFTYAAPILGAVKGTPWMSTVLAPLSFCSAYEPAALAPIPWFARLRPLGPGVVGFLFSMMKRISRSWSAPIREFRRELGLPADADPLWEGQHSPHGVLALFSSSFGEAQPDWPARTTLCGFPFYDRDFGGEEDDSGRLRAFLDAGEPPLVFSLGSSAVQLAGDFYAAAAAAAERLGRRAVLVTGSANAPALASDDVLMVRSTSVAPLFAAASVVIHAGGVGTTGQAMRAGCPQLVVPFAADHFDNALRVEQRGVGRSLRRNRVGPKRLASELDAILSDERIRATAQATGRIVSAEDGAETASDAIERALARGGGA